MGCDGASQFHFYGTDAQMGRWWVGLGPANKRCGCPSRRAGAFNSSRPPLRLKSSGSVGLLAIECRMQTVAR